MEDRLKNLLKIVVEDVVRSGEPVGSQHVVDTYKLDVSPATVRNWFAELETAGYLTQPHTSSGRVPTEKGYRVYLDELMEKKLLSKSERDDLQKVIANAPELERQIKELAKAVADEVGGACIVGLHRADTYYTGLSQLFSQPEFRDWNRVINLGEVLDRLDEVLTNLRQQQFVEPTVLMGAECPFGPMCGTMLVTLTNGTLIGLLGPMRMDYQRGYAYLKASKEILEK
jgi:transcriptional regulator of heat shock response